MMLWFDRHRRLRDQLSAYIDGELDSPAAQRLESHLAECERCRLELEQLRATVSGLQDLPELEPPRSFTLSPERVAAPRPRLSATPPLAFGARIAAAGLAAALAAVLVVDLGDIGGDGASDEAATQQMLSERQADDGAFEATGAATPDEAEAGVGGAEGLDETAMRDAGEAAETPAAGGVEPSAEGPEAAEATAGGPEEAEAPAATPSDGGIDALTAAEISLAAALGVLVSASLAFAFARRKR